MSRRQVFRWLEWLGIMVTVLIFSAGCLFPVDFAWNDEPASTDTRTPTESRPSTSTSQPTLTMTPTTYYRPVTWMELVDFISDDHTNWNEYDLVDYNCLDYAVDLVANAH
ncbi:MAG: hypothetical protein AB1531_02730, partial [Chloroflexota bacterium]